MDGSFDQTIRWRGFAIRAFSARHLRWRGFVISAFLLKFFGTDCIPMAIGTAPATASRLLKKHNKSSNPLAVYILHYI
jgi:hypothetical protein